MSVWTGENPRRPRSSPTLVAHMLLLLLLPLVSANIRHHAHTHSRHPSSMPSLGRRVSTLLTVGASRASGATSAAAKSGRVPTDQQVTLSRTLGIVVPRRRPSLGTPPTEPLEGPFQEGGEMAPSKGRLTEGGGVSEAAAPASEAAAPYSKVAAPTSKAAAPTSQVAAPTSQVAAPTAVAARLLVARTALEEAQTAAAAARLTHRRWVAATAVAAAAARAVNRFLAARDALPHPAPRTPPATEWCATQPTTNNRKVVSDHVRPSRQARQALHPPPRWDWASTECQRIDGFILDCDGTLYEPEVELPPPLPTLRPPTSNHPPATLDPLPPHTPSPPPTPPPPLTGPHRWRHRAPELAPPPEDSVCSPL